VLAGPQEQAQHSDFMQDSNSVQVTLALKDGKTSYRMGEAILLDLLFTATEPGYAINTTTTQPASPIDEIMIIPSDGVFSWLEDSSGGHRYYPDYAAMEELSPGAALHILLPLNGVYRIDKPGRYSVHVTTHRLQKGNNTENATPATTNEVSFDVVAMSDAEEQVVVDDACTLSGVRLSQFPTPTPLVEAQRYSHRNLQAHMNSAYEY
jgi:hypothetical protein